MTKAVIFWWFDHSMEMDSIRKNLWVKNSEIIDRNWFCFCYIGSSKIFSYPKVGWVSFEEMLSFMCFNFCCQITERGIFHTISSKRFTFLSPETVRISFQNLWNVGTEWQFWHVQSLILPRFLFFSTKVWLQVMNVNLMMWRSKLFHFQCIYPPVNCKLSPYVSNGLHSIEEQLLEYGCKCIVCVTTEIMKPASYLFTEQHNNGVHWNIFFKV